MEVQILIINLKSLLTNEATVVQSKISCSFPALAQCSSHCINKFLEQKLKVNLEKEKEKMEIILVKCYQFKV